MLCESEKPQKCSLIWRLINIKEANSLLLIGSAFSLCCLAMLLMLSIAGNERSLCLGSLLYHSSAVAISLIVHQQNQLARFVLHVPVPESRYLPFTMVVCCLVTFIPLQMPTSMMSSFYVEWWIQAWTKVSKAQVPPTLLLADSPARLHSWKSKTN